MSNESIDTEAQELRYVRDLMGKVRRTEQEIGRIQDFFGEDNIVFRLNTNRILSYTRGYLWTYRTLVKEKRRGF